MWQAAKLRCLGGLCERKGRDLCSCEERGGTREVSVCVCVSTCTEGWSFPPSSPHRHPLKTRVQKEPFNKR